MKTINIENSKIYSSKAVINKRCSINFFDQKISSTKVHKKKFNNTSFIIGKYLLKAVIDKQLMKATIRCFMEQYYKIYYLESINYKFA